MGWVLKLVVLRNTDRIISVIQGHVSHFHTTQTTLLRKDLLKHKMYLKAEECIGLKPESQVPCSSRTPAAGAK